MTVVLLFLACPAVAVAGSPEQLRMAIVLDDSGSMRWDDRDPRRLSVTAAMIAVQLSGPADLVALVPLNGRATPLMRGGNPALLRALSGLQRRGAETIYDRPLKRAVDLLGTRGKRMILFLTDGEPESRSKTERERVQQAQEAFLQRLAADPPAGVTFFPVVLGQVDPRWTGRLRQVAAASGGELFTVQRADGLIDVFASIYARMIHSKRVLKVLRGSGGTIATVDDFVRFANLVIVSDDDRAFSVSYPGRRGGGPAVSNGADAGKPRKPVFHYVDKIDVSGLSPGSALSVSFAGGGGAYRALLIYDYDLELHLARPTPRPDGSYRLRASLVRRSDGRPVRKQAFLEKVAVRARQCRAPCDPSRRLACTDAVPLALSCAEGCTYDGTFTPAGPGTTCIDARAQRQWQGQQTLDLISREVHRIDVPGGCRLSCAGGPLRFAIDQNKRAEQWRSCKKLTVRAPGLARPARLRLDQPPDLPEGTRLEIPGAPDNTVRLQPGAGRPIEVCLVSDRLVDRPGFEKDIPLRLSAQDRQWFSADGGELQHPAEVRITACSWWNRYKRLLFGLLLALVLLALLIWLIYGYIKPNSFPENLKVNWGKPIERLERNEMPVSEVPRSGRGFYRNAQLWVGGRYCFMGSGLPALARFEATSRRGISLFAEEGATVERVNKFESDKLDPVASGSPVGLGDIYKINDLFFRLKI